MIDTNWLEVKFFLYSFSLNACAAIDFIFRDDETGQVAEDSVMPCYFAQKPEIGTIVTAETTESSFRM